MTQALQLTGKRFGRLLVIARTASNKHGKSTWKCRCDCGGVILVGGSQLTRGMTKSCGCLQRELVGNIRRTHGRSKTVEYYIWKLMIHRCENANDRKFAHYGGRGIKVCRRWRRSFVKFFEDMGPRPAGLQINRIDNNGDYAPSNCEWVTLTVQRRNTRVNRNLRFLGQSFCLAEWSERTGIPYSCLQARIRRGWSTKEALTRPVGTRTSVVYA